MNDTRFRLWNKSPQRSRPERGLTLKQKLLVLFIGILLAGAGVCIHYVFPVSQKVILTHDGTHDREWQNEDFKYRFFVREENESQQNFITRVLVYASQIIAYDVTYHKTDIGIKVLRGFVITKRPPEVVFFTDGKSAVVWWWKDAKKFPVEAIEAEEKKNK